MISTLSYGFSNQARFFLAVTRNTAGFPRLTSWVNTKMTALATIQFIVLFGSLLVSVISQNCPYKECSCKHKDINCEERGLMSIPALIGHITGHTGLTMATNRITQIPAGSLPSNLTGIDFSRNPITTIDVYAFNDSQNTLDVLTFSEAYFTRIPDAFLHLRVLKSLTIEDTPIVDWNDAAIKNIASTLKTLLLINVTIHTWPAWMQYFTHLSYLSLEDNFLSLIPDTAMDMLANTLTDLVLSRNNLTTVPKTIQKLTALQNLFLDNNKLSYTTSLPLSSTLVILSLTGTHLVDARNLSNSLRPYAESLTDINLDDNNLSEIPDLSFLTRIDELDFTHNQISNPFAGSLSPIVDGLELDYNFLSAIPRVLFNLTSLHSVQMTYNLVREIRGIDIPIWIEDIELSYNIIIELTDTSFPENSSITSLSLVSNPIVRISQNAFKNLQQLTDLNLQNTKLTRLPLALASLTSLTWFDMDGNLDLVCTCEEKSLREWVISRHFSIDTKCGLGSISFFFQYLSSACP